MLQELNQKIIQVTRRFTMKLKIILMLAFNLTTVITHAQSTDPYKVGNITYRPAVLSEYLSLVSANNGSIQSKRYATSSAIAQKDIMSASNLNAFMSYGRGTYFSQVPYTPYESPKSNTVSLTGTIEGFGKRAARTHLSIMEIERNQIELELTEKSVQKDAAYVYLDTLRFKLILESIQEALKKLDPSKDQQDINTLMQAQKGAARDLQYFAYTMGTYTNQRFDTLWVPAGSIEKIKIQDFQIEDLIDKALSNRSDVLYLKGAIRSAEASYELAKKNRNINVTPSIWLSQTPAYIANGNDYKKTLAYGFSVNVPIPTHLLHESELIQEANNKLSLEASLNDLQSKVVAEVNQAFMQYDDAKTKILEDEISFKDSLHQNPESSAKDILSNREAKVNLIDSRINHLKALINLLQTSGIYTFPAL
jgi:outer membrane protein TolC